MFARFAVDGPSPKIFTSLRPAAFSAAGRPMNGRVGGVMTYFVSGWARRNDTMLSGAFWRSAKPIDSLS